MDKPANTAWLGKSGDFTSFAYNGTVVRFKTSPQLEKYIEIKKWERGYLEVSARYRTLGLVEDYIDLVPILENLYIAGNEFLAPIQQVRIVDA